MSRAGAQTEIRILPDPQGPWSFPPAPPAARPRPRVPLGLLIWFGLLLLAAAAYFALAAFFPGQLSSMDQASALQAFGLLALVSSGLVYSRRARVGLIARNLSIWLGFAAVLVAGYGFRRDIVAGFERIRGELIPAYAVTDGPHSMTITASADGSFYVIGKVNGASVRFVVDTGANGVVLSPADAKRAGVDVAALDFASPTETANGVGRAAPATVSTLDVGPMRLADVPVEVDRTPMSASLLGMAFLRRLDSFEIHGDQLVLKWRG